MDFIGILWWLFQVPPVSKSRTPHTPCCHSLLECFTSSLGCKMFIFPSCAESLPPTWDAAGYFVTDCVFLFIYIYLLCCRGSSVRLQPLCAFLLWDIFSRLARRCAFRLIIVSLTLIKTLHFFFFALPLKPQHLVMSLRESGLAALICCAASAAKKSSSGWFESQFVFIKKPRARWNRGLVSRLSGRVHSVETVFRIRFRLPPPSTDLLVCTLL